MGFFFPPFKINWNFYCSIGFISILVVLDKKSLASYVGTYITFI